MKGREEKGREEKGRRGGRREEGEEGGGRRERAIPVLTYNVTYTATEAIITASSNVRPSKVELVWKRGRGERGERRNEDRR